MSKDFVSSYVGLTDIVVVIVVSMRKRPAANWRLTISGLAPQEEAMSWIIWYTVAPPVTALRGIFGQQVILL
jgi:hypothetical protein